MLFILKQNNSITEMDSLDVIFFNHIVLNKNNTF